MALGFGADEACGRYPNCEQRREGEYADEGQMLGVELDQRPVEEAEDRKDEGADRPE